MRDVRNIDTANLVTGGLAAPRNSSMRDAKLASLDMAARELHQELTKRARSAMRGHAEAEDIAQESWARATAAIHKGGAVANVRSYLFRIARNLITDHHRRERARPENSAPPELLAEIADPRPNAEAQLVTRDELRRMDAIVAAMPARARQVFCLSRLDGLSYAEIDAISHWFCWLSLALPLMIAAHVLSPAASVRKDLDA